MAGDIVDRFDQGLGVTLRAVTPAEMIEHVTHPTFAATHVVTGGWPGKRPSQTGSVGNRVVDILEITYPLIDQTGGFGEHRVLDAIGDIGLYLFFEPQRLFARVTIKSHGPIEHVVGGLLTTHYLYQWYQIRRGERVADDTSFGMCASLR